jgi:sugar fermentation stimulation protein A
MLLFVIQRSDGRNLRPAVQIDPDYAARLAQVHRAGVEVLSYRFAVTPTEIRPAAPVTLDLAISP